MDKQFNKSPETIVFDTGHLKNGTYVIRGAVSQDWWHLICHEVNLPEAGGCTAALTVQISRPVIKVEGYLDVAFERKDVRTLDAFTQEQHIEIKEVLSLPGSEIEDALELEEESLDMGEFIREQVMLNFDEHPLKNPNSRGTFMVSDGLDDERREEKNPFSVLKHLKS